MIEPEVAFATLDDVAGLAESMLKYVFQAVLDERADDLKFFAERVDKDAISSGAFRFFRFRPSGLHRRHRDPAGLGPNLRKPGFLGHRSLPSMNVTWLRNTSRRRWW